jgi:hypothetical protein
VNWIPPAGTPERRRLVWLGVLVIGLGGYLWWSRHPAEAPAATSNTVATQERGSAAPLPVPDKLRLASLEDVPVLDDATRNPFGYGVKPAPPLPSRPVTAPILPPSIGPVVPPPPQGPPPIALKLTGLTVATPGGRTLVTLKDPATNWVYVAVEGEVLDGRYRVVKVGVESVVISYVDGTGMRTLPLGG